jgi:hypothetical protein
MKKLITLLLLSLNNLAVNAQNQLDSFVNVWHRNAANANLNDYFDLMSNDFVFLGTAPGERWNKTEFYSFCKPYFDKGKTWDFIPSERNWKYTADSTLAFFDESLSTWMGGCRGSGIFQKQNDNQWKLIYYNLTVLIENEKIQEFIQLRKKKIKAKSK